MVHVALEQNVNASAEDVWELYMGARALEIAIGVYAESAVIEGEGVGMVRITKLLNGAGTIRERVDALDEKKFHCKYSVLERGPFPYSDYTGQLDITPTGAKSCIMKLQADFTPIGSTEQASIVLYIEHNLKGIAKMKSLLGID